MIAVYNIQDISFEHNSIILKIDGKPIQISLDKISTHETTFRCPVNIFKHSPELTFHNLIVLSSEPLKTHSFEYFTIQHT
jgi:hypothetical protein